MRASAARKRTRRGPAVSVQHDDIGRLFHHEPVALFGHGAGGFGSNLLRDIVADADHRDDAAVVAVPLTMGVYDLNR